MGRKKLSMIGGGQIGGNLALIAAQKELGDIVIFDIPQSEGMVKGKALDIMQLRPHDGYDSVAHLAVCTPRYPDLHTA